MAIDPEILAREFTEVVNVALAPVKEKVAAVVARLDALDTTTRTIAAAQAADHDRVLVLEAQTSLLREWLIDRQPR